ncbi:hypothetical protein AX774_g7242 [Zancudomyces culisetae]|uniref:Uncharacterized protein n=1 Tax=Zancudomyces culisetae TaxID=1213189 RepID=A0A1R1PEE8_ZANCU|nr:hypothetical protein AX774_g7242 [Zancudomyces culisetae]|eukprot:OMH79347.1 hypothetical protein AX774_g7242 [Zancudomyces culisetae]
MPLKHKTNGLLSKLGNKEHFSLAYKRFPQYISGNNKKKIIRNDEKNKRSFVNGNTTLKTQISISNIRHRIKGGASKG